ncbi:glutamate ABC transporter permease [Methylobacterium sp. Leaf125]|jgi:glutamate/aspartate transport system permease protein|uniref:amino acid ABC transporter permease n=1 Tax=unclassified Methylobacterium TaxID=2615210 RepID=UPI0006FE4E07|nr:MULTISPECIES: amino acid ABC transporter permease [unclassified Methylobacterium]KQQ48028.1 glutamate ABC transporter permease [Methylobacterium sp. Leaf125]POR43809.1 amino acid ABC transporter permease [Methylobacterium sp. V23]
MNYNWNWGIFLEPSPEGTGTYADMLLSGLMWTVVTALCAWVIAFLLGSVIGVMRTLPSKLANAVGTTYVELFRNIPLLVQMFLWYFVLPEVLPESWGSGIKQLPNAPFYTAVVCLGFFTASRVAEQVRAGIQALPRGQKMAGTAMGLTVYQTYRYVLLPSAYRMILPPLTSEFLNNLKNTSVALTIGLLELTARARAMQEFSFQVFEAFTAATVLYVLINVVVIFTSGWIERRVAVPGHR